MKTVHLRPALSILLIFFLFLAPSFAQAASLSLINGTGVNIESALQSRLKKKMKEGTFFLLGISQKLKDSKEELSLLRDNIETLDEKIEESRTQASNLQSQLENLDRLITLNQKKIGAGKIQRNRIKNEIFTLSRKTRVLEKHLAENGEILGGILKSYLAYSSAYFEGKGAQASLLAFLSSESSSGEILREQGYLHFLETAANTLATDLVQAQDSLKEEKIRLAEKTAQLEKLDDFLKSEQETLEQTRESQERLLDQTRGKQIIYETLLEISKKEERSVAEEIQRLQSNFSFFEEKLGALQPVDQTIPIRLSGNARFSWPVSPSLGISAYFLDASYQRALGVPHHAVDIRVTQGSKVQAAADGIVMKAIDNGMGYSYIVIAHPGKFLTLYGHISDILVSEGEVVREGQTIGLSGGIPGTKGAGWLTTGAHLHFEVFENFKQVDPLFHLPLEFLPIRSLPEKYLERLPLQVR